MEGVSGDNSKKFGSMEKEKDRAGAGSNAGLKETLIFKMCLFLG